MKAINFAAKVTLTIGVLLALQGQSLSASAQTVYKLVDNEGLVTYTDRPPMTQAVETVPGLDIALTDNDFLDSSAQQQSAAEVADEIRENFENEEAAERALMAAAEREQRAAFCTAANQRLTKYKQAHRIYRTKDSGEREYLNSQELDAERAKAAAEVAQWCG